MTHASAVRNYRRLRWTPWFSFEAERTAADSHVEIGIVQALWPATYCTCNYLVRSLPRAARSACILEALPKQLT
jgi:hypothetical protein